MRMIEQVRIIERAYERLKMLVGLCGCRLVLAWRFAVRPSKGRKLEQI